MRGPKRGRKEGVIMREGGAGWAGSKPLGLGHGSKQRSKVWKIPSAKFDTQQSRLGAMEHLFFKCLHRSSPRETAGCFQVAVYGVQSESKSMVFAISQIWLGLLVFCVLPRKDLGQCENTRTDPFCSSFMVLSCPQRAE